MTGEKKRKICIAAALMAVIAAIVILAFLCWTQLPVFDRGKPVPFEIAPGGTARTVANQLNGQNVPISDTLFVLLVRLSRQQFPACVAGLMNSRQEKHRPDCSKKSRKASSPWNR